MKRGLPLGCRDLGIFYTDGLVEGQCDFMRGERQLEDVIARREIREADDAARAIRSAMLPSATIDDVAILVLRAL